MFHRRLGSLTLMMLVMGLSLPQTGRTDVASPEGQLTKTVDETCPGPSEVVIEDLDVLFLADGCDVLAVERLFFEDETLCSYAISVDCPKRGCN